MMFWNRILGSFCNIVLVQAVIIKHHRLRWLKTQIFISHFSRPGTLSCTKVLENITFFFFFEIAHLFIECYSSIIYSILIILEWYMYVRVHLYKYKHRYYSHKLNKRLACIIGAKKYVYYFKTCLLSSHYNLCFSDVDATLGEQTEKKCSILITLFTWMNVFTCI